MTSATKRRLTKLKSLYQEIEPSDAAALLERDGAVLVDVREPTEWRDGSPVNALRISRSFLELEIEKHVDSADRCIIAMCAGGTRSLFAADDLQRLGFNHVVSLKGGFKAWKDGGHAFEVPATLSEAAAARYARHLIMPEIGETGQAKLLQSKVLLVGAGGLGSPAALYLAASGIGHLGVVDHDSVDRSNLQRQILHTDAAVGEPKVESARRAIKALNPDVNVTCFAERLRADNVESILNGYDVVLDGTDNFAARYLICSACVQLNIPHIYAAVYRFEGQVSTFWPGGPDGGPCYRCLFRTPPEADAAPNCAEAGVMGVLPGTMGMLQATECVKLVLGIGQTLTGRLLTYDGLAARFTEIKLQAEPDCPTCSPGAGFDGYEEIETLCRTS